MIFSEFLGSLVLSDVEGLLLCIKTKKLERKNKIIEDNQSKPVPSGDSLRVRNLIFRTSFQVIIDV
jgi:hypothetical protein